MATASPRRPARTCSSTRTTPWTGTRGAQEALQRAKPEDRPILLSIGYSACHWCHVMERESFEDPEIAALMNEHFVPIKVDREERPDVDALYMEAVQAMTGQGGWPLTAFLDPDGVPFYGGTYFPPEPRQGLPSFRQVIEAVVEAYANQRDEIDAAARRIRDALGAVGRIEPIGGATRRRRCSPRPRSAACWPSADTANGGFGGAPKFPPATALEFLLARGEREHVAAHARRDGERRASTTRSAAASRATPSTPLWLVPHFEKMLYDNALLARAYLHGWQALGDERWRRICRETLDWTLREMRGPEGGFYSALDADSEGEEGRFYVWEEAEIREALSDAGLADAADERILGYWGVSPVGNFEGRNILHVARGGRSADAASPASTQARAALLAPATQRVPPGLDDKRLCSWNALMISALADAGAVLGRDDYLDAARALRRLRAASRAARRRRPAAAHLEGRRGADRAPTSRTTPILVEALLTLYRGQLRARAGSTLPARSPTR